MLGDGIWPNMDFDPEDVFSRVRVPVLLFYGEDDEWQHAPTLGGSEDVSAIAPE